MYNTYFLNSINSNCDRINELLKINLDSLDSYNPETQKNIINNNINKYNNLSKRIVSELDKISNCDMQNIINKNNIMPFNSEKNYFYIDNYNE